MDNQEVSRPYERTLRRPTSAGIHEECIEWDGSHNGAWYGQIDRMVNGKRIRKYAHRVAWESEHGPVPPGMCVLHRCDNPPCINVDHLFLGTKGDNMRDCVSKGRHYQMVKTHCKRGHPLDGDNLVASYLRRGYRACRICINEANRQRRERHSA